ncbi:MAG: ribonuclease III [Candidatus Algichlamydia australiensis]|nr:ribonuclease III [Chlamydiales bacterium]
MDPLKVLDEQLPEIEARLKISLHDKALLRLAFVHRSFANEYRREGMEHNERLEFLGDAVLELIVSSLLYQLFPDVREGELSQLRAKLVDATACQGYLRALGIDEFLLLGKGEQLNIGRGRTTLYSDLFEAIIGAIYLDSGLEGARNFFTTHFLADVELIREKPEENFKAILQDHTQRLHQIQPDYELLSEKGPEHEKEFEIEVKVEGEVLGRGVGNSKKIAQQMAAKEACEKLGIN